MIGFKHRGDFSKTSKWLRDIRLNKVREIFERYGEVGVKALSSATPVDTGKTASSWYYKINQTGIKTELVFCNSNRNNGIPIAIILQLGHGTKNGGWVQGRDYINPAIQPIFDEISKKIWGEVTKL